jgi:hypothetical protein
MSQGFGPDPTPWTFRVVDGDGTVTRSSHPPPTPSPGRQHHSGLP